MRVLLTHILRSGKDEKLRLRFDSSVARERCRRQRPEGRGAPATSNPSPCVFRYFFIFFRPRPRCIARWRSAYRAYKTPTRFRIVPPRRPDKAQPPSGTQTAPHTNKKPCRGRVSSSIQRYQRRARTIWYLRVKYSTGALQICTRRENGKSTNSVMPSTRCTR